MVHKSADDAGIAPEQNTDREIPVIPNVERSVPEANSTVPGNSPDANNTNVEAGEPSPEPVQPDQPIKRGRGRPRKNPIPVPETPEEAFDPAAEIHEVAPKVRRVKPREPEISRPKWTDELTDIDRALPAALISTVDTLATKLLGPEMTLNSAETETLIDVWSRYLRHIGMVDLPPIWLAVGTTVIVFAPKLAADGPAAKIKGILTGRKRV